MREEEPDKGTEDVSAKDFEIIEGAGLRFGDYAVIGPGVHIMLEGRTVSHPGE